ncbi:hypothetical protein PC112_g18393 [Phytophthora cactorum]|nr:hypothetical protein PC112_g18393 [Phytophthora cactorum]
MGLAAVVGSAPDESLRCRPTPTAVAAKIVGRLPSGLVAVSSGGSIRAF